LFQWQFTYEFGSHGDVSVSEPEWFSTAQAEAPDVSATITDHGQFIEMEHAGGNSILPGTDVVLFDRDAIRALVAFRFAFSFGKNSVIIFLPIFARTEFGMNAFLIGGVLAGGKLTKGIAQGYVGEFADRVGREEWFIFAGTITYAVGTALIPTAAVASMIGDPLTLSVMGREFTLMPSFFVLFTAFGILGLADSLRLPTSMALFVQEGEYYESVAGSLSLRSVAWQFGAIIGPLAVGAMFDYVSFAGGFLLASGLMIAAGLIFLLLFESEEAPDSAAALTTD
jgi:MFS family permease